MIKLLAIPMLSAVALLGQNVAQPAAAAPENPLSALQSAAEKKSAEWETLAQGLEPKIGRMLPCDPRVRAAIEDVTRASDARLAAMSQYLKAAVAMAKGDTEAAKAAASPLDDGSKDLETERAEAEQERIAVEGQAGNLADSVRRLPSLEAAQAKLNEIAAMIRERAGRGQQLADNRGAAGSTMTVPLSNLLAAYQTRQAALENEQSALAVESARWSDYYAARLARAQTECSIINQPARRKK